MRNLVFGLTAAAFLAAAGASPAQAPPADPAASVRAMDQLAFLDGRWEGEGWSIEPGAGAQRRSFRQTERVGALLDGGIRVIEGRGYNPQGRRLFNAFAVLSPDGTGGFDFRSYSAGRAGTFKARLLSAGSMEWTIPAGPNRIVYVITVKDGVWEEVGDYVASEGAPQRFFSMRLRRTGEASWVEPDAVPAV